MKNKNGFYIGDGECPCECNDGTACDWFGKHWVKCLIFKQFIKKVNEDT